MDIFGEDSTAISQSFAMTSLQNANWAQQQVHKQTHSDQWTDKHAYLLVSLKGLKSTTILLEKPDAIEREME